MNLLHIDSSSLGASSVSRELSRRTVNEWLRNHPSTTLEYLDLSVNPPSHLDGNSLAFTLGTDAAALTPAQKHENTITKNLLAQFLKADVLVIGAPMYNLTVPSQLKAWIDRVVQAGHTFRYTESGPEGLATGKTVIIVSTRGGIYQGLPGEALDHQESYLVAMFGFIGITDVRFVRAEGMGMGEQVKAQGIAAAESDIRAKTAQMDDMPVDALSA